MKYVILALDVDPDVENDDAHLEEIIQEQLKERGPIKAARFTDISEWLWGEVAMPGVIEDPDIYIEGLGDNPSEEEVTQSAENALENRRDGFCENGSLLTYMWDDKIPKDMIREVTKAFQKKLDNADDTMTVQRVGF